MVGYTAIANRTIPTHTATSSIPAIQPLNTILGGSDPCLIHHLFTRSGGTWYKVWHMLLDRYGAIGCAACLRA